MNTRINCQWRIARRPVGLAKESDFEWREEQVQAPGPGQLLVRNHYLSLDPTSRAWMWEEGTYLPAQRLGAVMRGITVGSVEKSNNPAFPEGIAVTGALGWQDYAVTDGASEFLMPVPSAPSIPPAMHLGLLGHIGMTAYFGLLDIGRPKGGETLVVSSAAGAVGSLVGQIGKLYGCRVVGITGTDEKCRWIQDELGFDAAINYKSESVFKRLRAHCPRGIDIYFDNVGGAILEDALNLLNLRARIVVCGMVSLYNDVGGSLNFPAGPNNLLSLMVKRARMEGFVCLDYLDRAPEAVEALLGWHRAGKIQYQLKVIEGLRNAPRAMNRMFDGSNRGKLVVKVS
ncbi:MAG TPA: NADP-dependent oxidoreductase [Burkholderiales bacterium]|nr:NADP-dependent oxidoreductase [Burkholderiales bacterium]